MKQFLIFLTTLLCYGCAQPDNYEIRGVCDSWVIPQNRQISMCLLTLDVSDGFDHKYIQTTSINSDGSFCFSGYVDSPQIVYFVTTNDEFGGYRWHAMGILEEGVIQLNCSAYQTERTFIDNVASQSPNNDKVQEYYKECYSIRRDNGDVEGYTKTFISENADNYAGVFVALDYLQYNYEKLGQMPVQIQNNPTIKEMVAEWQRAATEIMPQIELNEEIITIE